MLAWLSLYRTVASELEEDSLVDMKEMEEALASGTSFTEKKKKVVDASNSKDRETCTPGLRLFNTLSP